MATTRLHSNRKAVIAGVGGLAATALGYRAWDRGAFAAIVEDALAFTRKHRPGVTVSQYSTRPAAGGRTPFTNCAVNESTGICPARLVHRCLWCVGGSES